MTLLVRYGKKEIGKAGADVENLNKVWIESLNDDGAES